MAISLLFSGVIYSMINSEFVRFERMQTRVEDDIRKGVIPAPPRFRGINRGDIEEARAKLITTLALVNLGILVVAGGAGYFLAGRTLKPIKETIDEQKRFISDSSHELRTPLTSLRSEIEVSLMDKNLSAEKARKVLESNLEEVISLQTLSDRLLELAQNGKLVNKKSMEELSISKTIDSAIKKTQKMADFKQIKLTKKTNNITINGISDRLVEVFIILIDNAIKYSPRKSEILITTENGKGTIRVLIKDHGIGISDEDLSHIFDRFYRAEKSRTQSGYGLGLSIAKKIIEGHGGSIEAKSKLGEGTTFAVSLPK
jgi:two-component system sensor histidine kinase CiaH